MPDLVQYMWIVWLVFIVICVIVEVITLQFIFLMVALGSLGGLGTQLLGGPWWLQILVAFVLALLLIFVIRPVLLRATQRGADLTPTNLDALAGMSGRVVVPLGEHGGQVKLANGETWTALLLGTEDGVPASSRPFAPVPIDARVIVSSIRGSTAIVALPQQSNPAPPTTASPNESSAAS